MRITAGDVVEVALDAGYVYGRVLLVPHAYPPAIAFEPRLHDRPLDEVGDDRFGASPMTVLCPLENALAKGKVRIVGRTSAGKSPGSTLFSVPVRDRTGRVLYAWTWNGEELALPEDGDARNLPVREIVSLADLAERLDRHARPDTPALP